MRDVPREQDLKNAKIAPISNAISLNIKNERKEVLKNMENLRKSVKLKKRANPFEKIVSKIINSESIQEEKNEYLNNIPSISINNK